jgi:undecaprenyl-diphosphatase
MDAQQRKPGAAEQPDPPAPGVAGSRVDAGPDTESGPLGRVDPVQPGAAIPGPRPPLRMATLAVVAGFGSLIAVLVVLGFIAEAIRAREVFTLDTTATPFLHGIQSPGLDALMNALTTIGSSWVIPPLFVITAIGLIRVRRWGAATYLAVSALGGVAIEWSMKLFFARPRPQLAWAHVQPDYSFPSGHTMNSVIFYIALSLVLWSIFGRRIGLVAMTLASVLVTGVGISRIYLGYHYLTDVLGGILAGVAWLLIVGFAFRIRPTWWSWGRSPATVPPGASPAAASPATPGVRPPGNPPPGNGPIADRPR